VTGFLYGALGIAAFALTVFGATWGIFRLWCRPKRVLSLVSPTDCGLEFEKVQFPSQGIRLEGWFIPALRSDSRAPVIILVHGWNHHAGRMLDLAKAMHQQGFAALLFDARGHGRSGGDGPGYVLKFAQDIMAAVDYVARRPETDGRRIGVIGHSMGGSGAILAAAMDRRIGAVASSSAFSDPADLTRDTLRKMHLPTWPFLPIMQWIFRRWIRVPMEVISPRCRIGEIAVPVLLAHSDCDDHVLPANLEILCRNANPEKVQRVLLNGCKHSDMLNDRWYSEQVQAFFAGALKLQTRH